ncbi:DMT family transporter [Paenibacillus sp. MMS18-CY102]|uniref:DMT family transporter n=1 Tax=Paenibacillus sp. MMS18-CY102 TaxID=2682849 RepID=UPI0013653DBE|nr:DMT family transporter [Paenibacillus sp. MMS18-CY102]MWC29353.1 EamA family transporter [Paenibacillus sp. MMS18-CY102]
MRVSSLWKAVASPYIQLAIAMCMIGSFIVVNKVLSASVPVFVASGIRLTIGAVILNGLLWYWERGYPKLSRRDFLIVFTQSFVGVFLFSICLLYGVKHTSAVESGIITSTTPAAIGIISLLFFKERFNRYQITGIALALAGALVINVYGVLSGSQWGGSLLGNLLIFGAVIGEAIFMTFSKLLSANISPLASAALTSSISSVLFLPVAIYQAAHMELANLSAGTWGLLLYTGVVITVLAILLLNRAMSQIATGSSAVFSALMPVSAVVLSYAVLGESIYWYHGVGIVLVLAGIFSISRQSKPRAAADSQQSRISM